MSNSSGYSTYTNRPQFIDQLAIDVVVSERRYLKLTPTEKRHAAHRLRRAGANRTEISRVLRITPRTAERLLAAPLASFYDVNEDGERVLLAPDGTPIEVDNDGQTCHPVCVA